MKMKNRLAASVLAVALMTAGGFAASSPAYAASQTTRQSWGAWSHSSCMDGLRKNVLPSFARAGKVVERYYCVGERQLNGTLRFSGYVTWH